MDNNDLDKNLDKLVDVEIEDAIDAKPKCWYCESNYLVDGVCDDCGKSQFIFDEEIANIEDDSEGEVYFLKG